jgi:hypothetical protein
VRVSAGTDPSTGERIVLHRTVPIPEARTKTARERAEREAHKEAEKVLTRLQAELRELVERLPDEEVPAVLAQARRHVVPVEERPKSPTSFGVGRAVRPGVARRSEVIRVAVVRLDPPRHGPLVAAAPEGDDHQHACGELSTGRHPADRRSPVPGTVVAEVRPPFGRGAEVRVEALSPTVDRSAGR